LLVGTAFFFFFFFFLSSSPPLLSRQAASGKRRPSRHRCECDLPPFLPLILKVGKGTSFPPLLFFSQLSPFPSLFSFPQKGKGSTLVRFPLPPFPLPTADEFRAMRHRQAFHSSCSRKFQPPPLFPLPPFIPVLTQDGMLTASSRLFGAKGFVPFFFLVERSVLFSCLFLLFPFCRRGIS